MTLRVLLVEDERPVAKAVERHFRRAGYAPTVARNCNEVSALNECFDLGVFDIDLGDGLGVDLAEQCLAKGRVRAAVFYTGASHQETLLRAGSIGPVIGKTEGIDSLLGTVARLREDPRRGDHATRLTSAAC
jgi:DNA-binding response OmpR family regulator